MTGSNTALSDAPILQSYLAGKWQSGNDRGAALVNPSNGTTLAWASSAGLDLGAALEHARRVGGNELRKLTYSRRAEMLGKIADLLAAHRDRWYEIALRNSGNTKADAAIDVDGAIGTIKYFARLGASLGEATALADGAPARLAKDPNFQGVHIGVPMTGVAVHINAFNFPAWGLWEKAAVSLLAGVPVLSKPATSTTWLAQEMVKAVVDAGIAPPGSLSILCGAASDLLDHLRFGDLVAFTGSADTARSIREHSVVRAQNVRVNIEADSLNAALLAPDTAPSSPAFSFFTREVVREMTSKTGQKCTAIRRVLVPEGVVNDTVDAISAALDQMPVGNPENTSVKVGPVVNMAQKNAINEGLRLLSGSAEIVSRSRSEFLDADPSQGSFVSPTLLKANKSGDGKVIHELEIFGPVATVVPFSSPEDAFGLARRAGGSLAASVFGEDQEFLVRAASELGSSHGRVLLVDPSIGDSHTGHGIVLPSCMHGGPGRAGGGEELGGLRGLWFYHQRLAVQGSGSTLAALAKNAADVSKS